MRHTGVTLWSIGNGTGRYRKAGRLRALAQLLTGRTENRRRGSLWCVWVHLMKLRNDAKASISGGWSLLAILGIGGVAAVW